MNNHARRRSRPSGQAAVELALTLPLFLVLMLGTLQLFLLLQGRIMAQLAVYRAVRVGSVNQGNCLAMTHAAIATLLPSISPVQGPNYSQAFANGFFVRRDNHYADGGHTGQIVEIYREQPISPLRPEGDNDQPNVDNRLEVRMVYWFRMKIPFANWVLSRMFLAHFGLAASPAVNPALVVQKNPNWQGNASLGPEPWPGGSLATNMQGWAQGGQYLFPIKVSYAMRMMTPPRAQYFDAPDCPLFPTLASFP